ncbi:MAG: THUMP domain-containing class I SAM-dependent RNA methyltransferase [Gemmatimonadota bacterium]
MRSRRSKQRPGSSPTGKVRPASSGSGSLARSISTEGGPGLARFSCFGITAPGLSAVAAAELRALGVDSVEAGAEGVIFPATLERVFFVNLHSRVVSRFLVRLAQFRVTSFAQLERLIGRLPWDEWLPAGAPLRVRATCRKSRLYHSNAVAERIARSAGDTRPAGDDEEYAQLVAARIDRDICTVSIDSSGVLLHRRGYREALAKAPLRETLAAAMLLRTGWDGALPLADPLCGSGTIAIEAAMIAGDIAPGLERSFQCEAWPSFDASHAKQARAAARARVKPGPTASIAASDRDRGAIDAATANAERAGVSSMITLEVKAISEAHSDLPAGWLITNPPYGVRASEGRDLRDLHARIGQVLRRGFRGWSGAILAADRRLVAAAGSEFRPVLASTNGGIRVALYVAQ